VLAAAMLCAGGGEQPPRGERVAALFGRLVGHGDFTATLAGAKLVAAGRKLARAPTFSSVPRGDAFWYVNSNGLAEIAVNGGRAVQVLRLQIGSEIAIEL